MYDPDDEIIVSTTELLEAVQGNLDPGIEDLTLLECATDPNYNNHHIISQWRHGIFECDHVWITVGDVKNWIRYAEHQRFTLASHHAYVQPVVEALDTKIDVLKGILASSQKN